MDPKDPGAQTVPQAQPCAELAALFAALPQVPLEEVPQIDLYMDQVTTLIEQRMDWMRRNPGDKLLTKTMINNYTKDGVLPPPEKKKYSPRHLVDILLVYHLKQVLSIQDIGRLLGGMHQLPDEALFALYEHFLQVQRQQGQTVARQFLDTCATAQQMREAALELAARAEVEKLLSERLLDLAARQDEPG